MAVIVLARRDVERLLHPAACIAAVENAFHMRGSGAVFPSSILGIHVAGGGFHVKAAAMPGERAYFAAKINANFPANPISNGLPTIQGMLALFDAVTGEPLAMMDSIAITILRTAAATAVAARHLALADATTATIVGCGAQALAQIAAVHTVRPLATVFAVDANAAARDAFARRATEALRIPVTAADDLARATRASGIIITCTTSRRAFLGVDHVSPGAFIAAVGADNEEKQEIDPALLASAGVIVDSAEQCATIGDLHHAIDAGTMTIGDVRADLGQLVVDPLRGRRRDDEIMIFDSTGVAIEDVAAAALVYERARAEGIGVSIALGD